MRSTTWSTTVARTGRTEATAPATVASSAFSSRSTSSVETRSMSTVRQLRSSVRDDTGNGVSSACPPL